MESAVRTLPHSALDLRRMRDLEVAARIARIATEDSQLQPTLQRIVDAIRDAYNLDYVSLSFLDARRRRIRCEALSHRIDTQVDIGVETELSEGIVGRTARERKTQYIPDVQMESAYLPHSPSVRSELCIPVQHRQELIALLNVECRQVDGLRVHIEALESIAEQISGLIRNARIFEALLQRAATLEMINKLSQGALDAQTLDQAMENIAQFLRDRFNCVFCLVMLLEHNQPRLRIHARSGAPRGAAADIEHWPMDRGVVGRAARTGQTQFVPDVSVDPDYVQGAEPVRAELVVPIRSHGRFLGLLDLESTRADSFTESNRESIESIALQLGGTINAVSLNARLSSINREMEIKSAELEQSNLQLRAANAALERLSNLDGLTGIPNRRRFDEAIRSEWRRAMRHQTPISLLMIDLDWFKRFNDGYGHLAGDDCLKRVAGLLQSSLSRGEDLVARYGGEEFAALLPLSDGGSALACAERVQWLVRQANIVHAFSPLPEQRMSVSVGIATLLPVDSEQSHFEDLIFRADRALYRAKASGRDRIVIYDPSLDA